jgi:SNF2 family DNA or RNA helicase
VPVEITRQGDRIWLRSPYSPELIDAAKSVPGANWRRTEKVWTYPLTLDHCRALRATFGRKLVIADALREWASTAVAEEDSISSLGRQMTEVPLERVPKLYPGMARALSSRPYQSVAARYATVGRAVLIADTPGLGKTLEAIAGIVESGVPGPYLVAAPKTSTGSVWGREIESWVPDAATYVMPEGKSGREATLEEALDPSWDLSSTWVIVNIEMIRTKSWWVCPDCLERWPASDRPKSNIIDCGHSPQRTKTEHEHLFPALFGPEWGAIVMDECQKSLIRTTGTPTQTRNGARLLRSREDGLRLALSGTPMRGKSQRLWGTLNWLRPKTYTGYWGWVEMYWEVFQSGFAGARTVGDLIPERETALNKSLDAIMIRRTKAEVSPELPPKLYGGERLEPDDPNSPVGVWLPMTRNQQKAYESMLRNGSAEVEGGSLNAIGGLAEMTRLKQFASCYGAIEKSWIKIDGERHQVPVFRPRLPSNKWDWVLQFLTERSIVDPDDAPTGKVIIVSQFTQILDLYQEELGKLGVKSLAITGKVTNERRQQAQDLFNDMESGYNVMFLNTLAGGVSITLDAADDMVFIDETHVPDDQEQAEDRINNRRPEEKVAVRTYWYIKSVGTIDEAIARINLHSDIQQKKLLDDRRGVEYIRAVLEQARELVR